MQKIDTLDFVKKYWIWKKFKTSGENLMICCPFHKENNPSFGFVKNTYFDGKSFHCKWGCFTCHESGYSLEAFVAKMEEISYSEAKKELKEMLWLEDWVFFFETFEKISTEKTQKQEYFSDEEYVNEFDTFTPHQYMLERGFSINSWLKFNMWFSEKRKRIGVPLVDVNGKIVSIIGRSIDQKINPKYLYINKNDKSFEKTNYLFKFNQIDVTKDLIVVVEWPLNSIMIDQFGEPNAVAIMGSTISAKQYEDIVSNFNNIVLWFDNDKAWNDGVKNFIYKIKKDPRRFSKNLSVIKTPKDAAEMTEEEFRKAFDEKQKIDILF